MNQFDLLLTTLLIGAMFNGMRRGFMREVLIFALWLPLYAVSVLLAFKMYLPQSHIEGAPHTQGLGHNVFWLLGFIFILGSLFISIFSKAIIQPWLQKRRLQNTQVIDSVFGFFLGGVRFLVLVTLTVFIYDVFVSPFSLTGVPNSVYVKTAYNEAAPLKRWLIKENYLEREIILYDRDYEEDQERKNRLKEDYGSIFGLF